MCSAQTWAAYRKYVKVWGADFDIDEFVRLYGYRAQGGKVRIPKAMDAEFRRPTTDAERKIAAMIAAFNREQADALSRDIFSQRKRQADAGRALASKITKKALNELRISTDTIDRVMTRLDDLKRSELKPKDSRIFPGTYAPFARRFDTSPMVLFRREHLPRDRDSWRSSRARRRWRKRVVRST